MAKRDNWKTERQNKRAEKESARMEFARIDPVLRREIVEDSRAQALARKYDLDMESE